MKACPVCQSTFDDRVDFCFEDGAPLVVAPGADPADAPDMAAAAVPDDLSGLDVPEAVALTERRTDQEQVEPRRSGGRGMFSRPSVADMLSIAQPRVPPEGGLATPEAPQAEAPAVEPPQFEVPINPAAVDAVLPPDVTMPPTNMADVESSGDPELEEPEAPVEEPEAPVEEPEVESEAASAADLPEDGLPAPIAIAAPLAAPVEISSEEVTETIPPMDAGAIFDAPDPSGFFEEGRPTDSLIEDPGFPEVGVSSAPEPVGYDDKPFFAHGAAQTKSAVPLWLIGGSLVLTVIIAILVLVVILGGPDKPHIVHKAKTVQPLPPPVVAPPPEPIADAMEMEDPEEEELEPEEELEEELDEALPVPMEAQPAEEAVPEPVEPDPVEPPPVVPLPVEPPPEPEPVPPPPEPEPSAPSAWTGTPVPSPSTGSTSPWGAPAEASARGRLTVSTEPPSAMVYVDNRRVGRAPTGTEVTYGSHTIRAELDNYRTITRTVDVQVPQISIPLRMQAASLSGTCSLMGPVGANVVMDGRNVGSLPRSVSCTEGPHRFQVTPTGGAAYTLTRDVYIPEPGATVPVSLGGS
jgi:hypothetical protein